jgi:hypothetical protein
MWPHPVLDSVNPLTALLGQIALGGGIDIINGDTPILPHNFLTLLVRSIDLPKFDVVSDEDVDKIPTDFGYLTFPGKFSLPSDNKFTLTFLDTELSPLDTFFSYWLAQTTAQTWAYVDTPYTIASFFIMPIGEMQSFGKQTGYAVLPKQIYCFLRCFPSSIELPKFDMNNGDSIPLRNVEFKFSKMFVIPNIGGFLEWSGSKILSLF